MQKYIDLQLQEMIKTLNYHENIFGINSTISVSSYLSLRNEIFSLIQIFSTIDKDFANKTFFLLFDDILSIMVYFDKFKLNADVIKKSYDSMNLDNECPYDEFNVLYKQRFKDLKQKVIAIINTKLYYLDLFLWQEVKKSSLLDFYLKQKKCLGVSSTSEYLKHNKSKKIVNTSFVSSNYCVLTKYDETDLSLIRDLDLLQDDETDPLLNKLIKSKNSITFFKNMDDEDIKKIVKNISFIKYKMHETIIKQDDEGSEIFYLLSGTARVIVGTNALGTIEKENIFGEFSSVTGEKRSATIKANDHNVTVLRFKFAFESFADIPYSFTYLYKNIIDVLIAKIHNSNTQKAKAEDSMLNEINKKINDAKNELNKTNLKIRAQKKSAETIT